ncbi:hypothetical protein ACXR0O_25805 [Verrucomicrobiota bacterium sgz303538]
MRSSPFIERLETRIAPASVTATLSGGTLKIVAASDSAETDFMLRQTGADSFDLYDNSVSITPIHLTGVKAIKATLSPLDDHVVIYLNGETSPFRGSITIDGVSGSDSINVGGGGTLEGDLTVKITGTGGSIEIGNEMDVRGSVRLSSAGGHAEIYSSLGSLTATGFSSVYFGYAVDIRGAVKITAAPHTDMTVTTAGGTYGHFRGNLTIIGSDANDRVEVRGTVDGDIKLKLGEGENSFLLGGGNPAEPGGSTILGGSLNYTGGFGSDFIKISAEATLGSTMKVRPGGGDNALELLTADKLTALTYQGGKGADTFTFGIQGGDFLRARVNLGGGSDQATISNTRALSLRLDGGDGTDVLNAVDAIAGLIARRFEPIDPTA